ncbi:MAG: thermonuclease family protein [Verrucomicrobiaceae bacterium]|nr:thermonuclease family protein [Verrucomicrobiaceae bacterium]
MRRPRQFPLLCFIIAMIAPLAMAETFTGKVVAIGDGDSLTVLTSGQKQVRIRLEGIDAPESKQAFGSTSKKSLSELAFGREVKVVASTTDDYGRKVAQVYLGTFWINLAQVERGMAWHYTHYSSDPRLHAAEAYARSLKLGLWSGMNPTPPWTYRHRR